MVRMKRETESFEDVIDQRRRTLPPGLLRRSLKVVDPDIAESFKCFRIGTYHLDQPLKLQIARSLKKLVRLLEQKESEKIKVGI